LATGMMAVLGGVWRHLSGDYGPNLAVVSGLLFFIALSQPAGWSEALVALVWVAVGGLIGILVQLSAWFFRPQHALRAAVAESWVAVSDLITAMRTESNEGKPCARAVTEQEGRCGPRWIAPGWCWGRREPQVLNCSNIWIKPRIWGRDWQRARSP